MKKPSGRFEVEYASGRKEELLFKTYEGRDYKELVKDLRSAQETGAIKNYSLKLGKS